MAQTIFDKVGGFSTVRQVVSSFYDKVLDSPTLAPFFANTDMRRQIDHQTQFISSLMGGPGGLSNDILMRVHAPLGISKKEFVEIAGLLESTMFEFGIEPEDVDVVLGEFNDREAYVVTKHD